MHVPALKPVREVIAAGAEDGCVEVRGGEEGCGVDEGVGEWGVGRVGEEGGGVEEVGVLGDVDAEGGGGVWEGEALEGGVLGGGGGGGAGH